MIKEDSFYIVQSWMITDLKLKGNEKDIFAIIYGFTNSEQKEFNGSLSYLAEWTNCSFQVAQEPHVSVSHAKQHRHGTAISCHPMYLPPY